MPIDYEAVGKHQGFQRFVEAADECAGSESKLPVAVGAAQRGLNPRARGLRASCRDRRCDGPSIVVEAACNNRTQFFERTGWEMRQRLTVPDGRALLEWFTEDDRPPIRRLELPDVVGFLPLSLATGLEITRRNNNGDGAGADDDGASDPKPFQDGAFHRSQVRPVAILLDPAVDLGPDLLAAE